MYLAVVDEICPYEKNDFENISLSARTCVRRTEELGNNLMQQLKENINSFNFFHSRWMKVLMYVIQLKF
jgi:hypothetical protein